MSSRDKSKQPIHIFLSYAMEDSDRAKKLLDLLNTQPNLKVFTSNNISAGENWSSMIRKQISKSDYFLVLFSPNSVQSKWVQLELGAAWGLNKSIVPVVTSKEVADRLPLDIQGLQIIELKDLEGQPESIGRLIESYEKTAA